MRVVLWVLWLVVSPTTFGCSMIVLPILGIVWLVIVYQTSF